VKERDKQVQIRLTPEVHKKLKIALIENSSSLVDFFNEAAEAYLKNGEAYNKNIKKIIGGTKNEK
jgi:hypothetical protein